MGHRDTDTEKWNDEWFQALPMSSKLLWLYVCDRCDHAGVWKENRPLAEFQIGTRIDWKEVREDFVGRVDFVDDRWVILGFIRFHYGELTETHKMLKAVNKALWAHKMRYSIDTLSIVYLNEGNTLSQSQDRVKDKDKDNVLDKRSAEERRSDELSKLGFKRFWDKYPLKMNKVEAENWWLNNKPNEETVCAIVSALEWQPKQKRWADSGYIPNPNNWLENKRWLDEKPAIKRSQFVCNSAAGYTGAS